MLDGSNHRVTFGVRGGNPDPSVLSFLVSLPRTFPDFAVEPMLRLGSFFSQPKQLTDLFAHEAGRKPVAGCLPPCRHTVEMGPQAPAFSLSTELKMPDCAPEKFLCRI